MKPIKIHIAITAVMLMCQITTQAQTWHIQDDVVFAEKLILGGMLAFEIVLKNRQVNHMKELAKLEDELEKKRGPLNLKANAIIAFADKMFQDTESKINTVITDLNTGFIGAKLRHGLSRYRQEINTEKRYLDEMKGYRLDLILGLANSGGPGYNINAALKMLIRLTKINTNVNKIYLNVKNSIVLNQMEF